MALKDRIEFFDLLCGNFQCDRPAPLIAVHQIDQNIYNQLQRAVMVYISRCISQGPILDEDALIEELELRREKISNCTPNGLIKPYHHVAPEFNRLYKAFGDLVVSLEICECVPAFYSLIDVRFKEGTMYEKNVGRSYSTEELHVDSWATGINNCIRMLIPICGDVEGNGVEFYTPPYHFQESWLEPLPNYKAGLEIARQYSLVDVAVPRGSVCFFDVAVIHRTVRAENSGGRISLGNSIYRTVPKKTDILRPHLTVDDILSIGKTKLLSFASFDENHTANNIKHWELVSVSSHPASQ